MKKVLLIAIFSSLLQMAFSQAPNWTVNPAGFQYSDEGEVA